MPLSITCIFIFNPVMAIFFPRYCDLGNVLEISQTEELPWCLWWVFEENSPGAIPELLSHNWLLISEQLVKGLRLPKTCSPLWIWFDSRWTLIVLYSEAHCMRRQKLSCQAYERVILGGQRYKHLPNPMGGQIRGCEIDCMEREGAWPTSSKHVLACQRKWSRHG